MWPQLAMMAAMAALNKFTSKGDKFSNIPTYTKGQNQLLGSLLGGLAPGGLFAQGGAQGTQYLQGLLNPESEAYQAMEKPYMQRFQQEIVPGLAERFAGAGAMGGGLSSSGFGQSLSAAGGNLAAQLAALRATGQQNAARGLMGNYQGLLGSALGARSFLPSYQPGNTGLFGPALSSMGQGIGYQMGNPAFAGNFQDWLINSMPGGV